MYSYNYSQRSTATSNSSNTRVALSTTNESHSVTKINTINNELQSVDLFGNNTRNVNPNSNNSFLSNNYHSITTDLSENNSLMMVGGGTTPGDPGVPVGDGMLLFFFLEYIYVKS